MADVHFLAADERAGRKPDTPGSEAARDYIVERLLTIGVEKFPGSPWRRAYAGFTEEHDRYDGVNVVAQVPGTQLREDWIVLTAHYDHLGVVDGKTYNGADDNASGVAAALAISELVAKQPLQHSLAVVFLDGEELDFSGARGFFSSPPIPPSQMALNINLDMVARGDNGILWAVRVSPDERLTRPIATVAQDAAVCLEFGHDGSDGRQNWQTLSDHRVFAEWSVPFVYFGVDEHDDYHEPSDDVKKIDEVWFTAAVETLESTLRALDAELAASPLRP
jgi:Zn-dependent M28 family amino/carboxypeptidase